MSWAFHAEGHLFKRHGRTALVLQSRRLRPVPGLHGVQVGQEVAGTSARDRKIFSQRAQFALRNI